MESFNEVVEYVKKYISEQIAEVAFQCWISCIEPVKLENNQAIIYVKTVFQKNVLEKQYLDILKEGFKTVLGFDVQLIIATEETINSYTEPAIQPIDDSNSLEKTNTIQNGNYEYTFDTFIVGPSNNFAYAACKAVSSNTNKNISSPINYNPLFIYGPSGLGKTHLLMAIANETRKNHPEYNIISVSSESFINELISCLQNKSMASFHSKYRSADLLLVDDIQFMAGKDRMQEEFFHTFNELYKVGKQIVVTSDRPPKDIQTLEDRMKSRFESGLLADITPPDFETRVAIINRKADLLDLDLPVSVAEFIANHIKNNIRQLEGAVKKLVVYKSIGVQPSLNIAQTVIKEIMNDNAPAPITVERIIEEVSKTYSVSEEDIRSNKRNATYSLPRKVAAYIVREITSLTMEKIGEEFGNRNHSTIVYLLKEASTLIENDPKQKAIAEDIIKNIKEN